MREILFRGKTTYKSHWVEGFYYLKKGKYAGSNDIIYEHHTITTGINEAYGSYGEHSEDIEDNVFPETVGQYTGVTDKNGKKIFEGDIVKACITENHFTRTEDYEGTYEIKYHNEYCYFYLAKTNNNLLFDGNWRYFVSEIEVIGNIHDNPELLKGGEK